MGGCAIANTTIAVYLRSLVIALANASKVFYAASLFLQGLARTNDFCNYPGRRREVEN